MIDAAAVARLPKIELHCHLEGTMRPGTVADLARRHGHALPVDDPTALYHYDDLTGFLRVFWIVQAVLKDRDDWARLAYESVIDGAAHGLVHRESFFTPARLLADGQRLADIVAGIDEGLAAAERDTGVTCRMILDMDREFGPAAGREQVEQLISLQRAGAPGAARVIGIGMDSTERGVDPATYHDAYRLAARAGLRRTAHQGENSPASAIATAVDVLGCERIDHGIAVFGDADLVRRLADRRLPFTVCPNANVRINPDVCPSLDQHVFPAMHAAGLLVTLNTDDPALTALDLTQEYTASADAFGYGWGDVVAIALNAVEASWLDDADARRLAAVIERAGHEPRPA